MLRPLRHFVLAILVAAAACKPPKTLAPPDAAAVVVAAAPDAARPADARPADARPPDARPTDADIADAEEGEPDAAPRETLFQKEVTGPLVVLGGPPLEGATVRLACTRELPEEAGGRYQCDSQLTVTKDGKVVATAEEGVAGIDFEPVAGNNGSVDLELFVLEADSGAAFVAVRASAQEGDEQMQAGTDLQLFAVRGDGLAKVLQVTVHALDEPGPDGGRRREETETTVEPGKKKTGGMRNLIGTERDARSGRTRSVVTYVWDGEGYVDKKTLAAPDAGAQPSPP
jgi:hypothetical protein